MANLKTEVTRKQSTPNFRKNEHFLPQGGKKCSFFGKFGVVCFLVTSILRFALLPYYRRIIDILVRAFHDGQQCRALTLDKVYVLGKQ